MKTIFRHELKYIITENEYNKLVPIIGKKIPPSNYYKSHIESIYYDTEDHKYTKINLDSSIYKEKFRIRFYNNVHNRVVEYKRKYNGRSYKNRIKDIPKNLKPFCRIGYDRISYETPDNKIRITFDKNIKGRLIRSTEEISLLDENLYIMEVKVLYNIPYWLSKELSKYEIYPQKYSKFKSFCKTVESVNK